MNFSVTITPVVGKPIYNADLPREVALDTLRRELSRDFRDRAFVIRLKYDRTVVRFHANRGGTVSAYSDGKPVALYASVDAAISDLAMYLPR